MAKNRLVRQKPAEDDDTDLSGDVAMVGGADDGVTIVAEDEGDDKTKIADNDDETWDGGKKKPEDGDDGLKTRRKEEDEEGDVDEEEDDLRAAYDDSDEDAEERRRGGRRSRRNRSRRQAIDQRDTMIAALNERVARQDQVLQQLQGGHISIAANSLEGQLTSARQAMALADQELAKAVTEGNGEKYREIMQLRDEAAQRVFQLNTAAARLRAMPQPDTRLPNGQQQQQGPTPQQMALVERAERFANTFMDRNEWFDPQGTDRDSRIARQIDEELATEGYQSHTPAYWREFEMRCKDAGLGGHERDDEDERPARREREAPVQRRRGGGIPPTGAVRSSSRPGRGGFTLSAVQMDLLREEGLDGTGLSKEDQARKDRIIGKWKLNARALRSGA